MGNCAENHHFSLYFLGHIVGEVKTKRRQERRGQARNLFSVPARRRAMFSRCFTTTSTATMQVTTA